MYESDRVSGTYIHRRAFIQIAGADTLEASAKAGQDVRDVRDVRNKKHKIIDLLVKGGTGSGGCPLPSTQAVDHAHAIF